MSFRKVSDADKAAQEKKINQLYSEIGRLTTQLNWLKKNLASTLARADRLAMVERDNKEISLSVQAKLLSLNRTGIYLFKLMLRFFISFLL